MKNFFTLLLGGLLTTSAFANNITLNVSGSRNFQVRIDGRNVDAYNDHSVNSTVYLNNLRTGRHSIEVYRTQKRGWGNSPVYSSSFDVSPQYDLNITVDNKGRVKIYQSRTSDYSNGDRRGNGNYDRRYDDRRNGDAYPGGYGQNGDYRNNSYNRAVSDYDFERLVQKIRGQWIGKLGTARDAINGNYFTTYQVREILGIFSSENDRLELAKLAFVKVVDQQNFRQLYDQFSYKGQAELDNYTRYNSRY
jgi:hypothetical protein